MKLRKGDLIELQWLDIFEDSVGDPNAGDVATRLSIGYFWDIRQSKVGGKIFVTSTTIDTNESKQNGYCAYPLNVVVEVKLIRRGKGKVYRAQPEHTWEKPEGSGGKCVGQSGTGDAGERGSSDAGRGVRNVPEFDKEVHETGKLQA